LEDLHHQQYLHMTAGRKKEFDHMNGPINHARTEKNALEAEKREVMGLGSNVGLRRDDTLPTLSKPSYEKGMLHAYGNIGAGIMAAQQRKAESAHNGMLHAYGNIGDGLRMEQERKQREEHAYAIGTGGVSEPFDTSTGMGHAYESFGYDVKNESEVPEKRYPCPDHGIHKMHRITTIPVILSKKTKRPFAELGLSPSYFLCSCGEGVFCNSWPDVGPPLGYYLLKSETSTTFGWGMAVTVWADKEVLPWANTLPGFSFEN